VKESLMISLETHLAECCPAAEAARRTLERQGPLAPQRGTRSKRLAQLRLAQLRLAQRPQLRELQP